MTTEQPRREAVSVQQAAEWLDVNYETVRRLVFSKKLAAFKVGRVWRIRRAAIVEYAHRERQ